MVHYNICFAQVEGFVSDAKDGNRIPFTHVVNLNTAVGVLTDTNGFFRIDAQQDDVLQFSHIGYFSQTITIDESSQINVVLYSDPQLLTEIVVRPGENPAHRIINNAIANRHRNNPDNRVNYTCLIYSKLTVDITEWPIQFFGMDGNRTSHSLINEAVIKRQYRYRGNSRDHIIASRSSGFDNFQQLAFLPSMLQPFHFYHDVLEWKMPTRFFLNPISPGSTSNYLFLLRDTIVSGVDSTFIISFEPRRSTNFEGLRGVLYINSNGWAIQRVVAEPADYSPIRMKIRQNYSIIDSVWFPSELNLEMFVENFSGTGLNFIVRGTSHIVDVDLNPDLTNMSFRGRNITIADNAHKNTEILDRYRSTELTPKEEATFKRHKDSSFDMLFHLSEGLTDRAALSVGIIDFPLNRIIRQNYTEGFRFGLGAYTNRHLSPWFSIGGYFGYGFNDNQLKHGASFSFFPEQHLDSEIKLWWANDIYSLTLSNEVGISARRLWDRFDLQAQFKVQDIQPTFNYLHNGQNMTTIWRRNAEASFRLRYAHNERRAKLHRRSIPISSTRYPILFLNVCAGIPSTNIGSIFQYIKIEAGVEQSRHIRNLGTFSFSLWGGWMNGEVPFPLMFNVTSTEQSMFLTRSSNWRTRFNALTGSLYASNQYLNAFLYHDFGTLLGRTNSSFFRPRIAIAQSFGWSKMNYPEKHTSNQFSILDMRNGYFESGIVIEDVIRIEFLNAFFLTIGGGVYVAYGGSVLKPLKNTVTPKMRISVSL